MFAQFVHDNLSLHIKCCRCEIQLYILIAVAWSTLFLIFAPGVLLFIVVCHLHYCRYRFTVTNDGYAALYEVAITDSSLLSGMRQAFVYSTVDWQIFLLHPNQAEH